ncbi:hypothetical protein Golob_018002, partial [Gossypium lobatum]|nr:hypothetical protein [Gossypium lobatum]
MVDDKGMKLNPTNITPISWKDKLMGDMANVMNTQKDENFYLQKADAKNEIVDGIPSITFSERVTEAVKGHDTKSLLKFIGSEIGLVAKIDRNTKNNSKGQFAKLAILALPKICSRKMDQGVALEMEEDQSCVGESR